MTDREMIEKMAKLDIEESGGFYSAYINDMRISKNKPLSVSKTIMSFDCPKKYILEAIGIPKGAVVLTKEEYEQLAIEYKRWEKLAIEDMITQARKETAREILKEFEYCNDTTFYSKWLELAKQYGVDIEE